MGFLECDVAVIGAGPAGLAAAVAAREAGAERVVVLEREGHAGGVLPQCVHDGFGLHLYGEALTGSEYAARWEGAARAAGARLMFATTVLESSHDGGGGIALRAVGAPLGGAATVRARAVVAATGCRERTRGQLGIPGTRPSGVLTAGTAQYLMNVGNQLPGDKAVILGSGDIGLIMARRLTLEGAEVRLVLGQKSTGLLRNHLRCIQDFGIPLREGWGVASVHGLGTLKGVTVAPLRADGSFDMARREYVRCNLLLLACGLIPDREAWAGLAGGAEDAAALDAAQEAGLFVCGNARKPHDLADQVTQEGLAAGAAAARHAGFGGLLSDASARLAARVVREPKGRLSDLEGSGAEGRVLACTVCPTGCVMRVRDGGEVSGAGCARGEAYARSELACPMRLYTGTVRLEGAARALMPVRTSKEVPLAAMRDVARACRRVRACAPVACGDILRRNVGGTGADLVACSSAAGAEGECR